MCRMQYPSGKSVITTNYEIFGNVVAFVRDLFVFFLEMLEKWMVYKKCAYFIVPNRDCFFFP